MENKNNSGIAFSSEEEYKKCNKEFNSGQAKVDFLIHKMREQFGKKSEECLPSLITYKQVLNSIYKSNSVIEMKDFGLLGKQELIDFMQCYKKITHENLKKYDN